VAGTGFGSQPTPLTAAREDDLYGHATACPRARHGVPVPPEIQADLQITADNIKHFGEPVYEYDMSRGTGDGYLALCEIQKGRVNLDDTGITLADIIVFFKYVRSPIAIYQMVGRGTRLDPASGKLTFCVCDYTDATRLFGQAFVGARHGMPVPRGGDLV